MARQKLVKFLLRTIVGWIFHYPQHSAIPFLDFLEVLIFFIIFKETPSGTFDTFHPIPGGRSDLLPGGQIAFWLCASFRHIQPEFLDQTFNFLLGSPKAVSPLSVLAESFDFFLRD